MVKIHFSFVKEHSQKIVSYREVWHGGSNGKRQPKHKKEPADSSLGSEDEEGNGTARLGCPEKNIE